MSKTIAPLLFASALFVAPLLTGGALQFASTPSSAHEKQTSAAFDVDEGIVYVDMSIGEETRARTAQKTNIGGEAPVTGIAVPTTPVLETTQDFAGIPVTGFAAAEEPTVIESVARIALFAEEAAQTASAQTDMATVSQMVSSLDDMAGKMVMDRNGELMGTIVGVNDETTTLEVELMDGRRITLLNLPTDLGNGLVSVDLSDVDYGPITDPSSGPDTILGQ